MEGKAAIHFPVDYHNAFLPLSSLVLDVLLFYSISEKSDVKTENAMLGKQCDILVRAMKMELEDCILTLHYFFFYFRQVIQPF